jgi:hypothetical protein
MVPLVGALVGCLPGGPEPVSPRIVRVDPSPVRPGEPLTVYTEPLGPFDATDGAESVALGGRPQAVTSWANGRIEAQVAVDTPFGWTRLVVTENDGPTAWLDVEVSGDVRSPDLGLSDADAAPGARDLGVDASGDAVVPRFQGEVLPDPASPGGFFVEPADAPPGEVAVRVMNGASTAVWGVAFHVTWDPVQLDFVTASVPSEGSWAAKAVKPGRLVFGGVLTNRTPEVVTLRFAIVGRGERRLSLPAAYAEARGVDRFALPGVRFTGATVRTTPPPEAP